MHLNIVAMQARQMVCADIVTIKDMEFVYSTMLVFTAGTKLYYFNLQNMKLLPKVCYLTTSNITSIKADYLRRGILYVGTTDGSVLIVNVGYDDRRNLNHHVVALESHFTFGAVCPTKSYPKQSK